MKILLLASLIVQLIFMLQCVQGLKIGCWTTSYFHFQNVTKRRGINLTINLCKWKDFSNCIFPHKFWFSSSVHTMFFSYFLWTAVFWNRWMFLQNLLFNLSNVPCTFLSFRELLNDQSCHRTWFNHWANKRFPWAHTPRGAHESRFSLCN